MNPRAIPDLMIFLEVVRAGSITKAAQRLNMVQSNVTARIKKLERATATPLFQRHARGVKVTPAGEATLAVAQRMEAAIDDLRFTFGQGAKSLPARLRIGAIETVLAAELPKALSAFKRDHENVEVLVRPGSSVSLVKQLQEGELDAVFVSRPFGLAGYAETLAFTDELVAVMAGGQRRGAPPWSKPDAALTVLVQRLGCSYTERLLAHLAATTRCRVTMREIGTLEGVLGFVEAGLGVAAMPRSYLEAVGKGRQLQCFDLPANIRTLRTYLLSSDQRTFAANAFVGWFARRRKADRPAG